MLPVSLSRGALIAILACIFVLLGKLVTPLGGGGLGFPHALRHGRSTPCLSYSELVFLSQAYFKRRQSEAWRKGQTLEAVSLLKASLAR